MLVASVRAESMIPIDNERVHYCGVGRGRENNGNIDII